MNDFGYALLTGLCIVGFVWLTKLLDAAEKHRITKIVERRLRSHR